MNTLEGCSKAPHILTLGSRWQWSPKCPGCFTLRKSSGYGKDEPQWQWTPKNTKIPTSVGYSTELRDDRQMLVQRTNCASLEPNQSSILDYILYWHILCLKLVWYRVNILEHNLFVELPCCFWFICNYKLQNVLLTLPYILAYNNSWTAEQIGMIILYWDCY